MKRRKVRTIDDMMAAPEGEWFELPEGLDLKVVDDTVRANGKRIVVALPLKVLREFRPGKREVFTARVRKGKLIVERRVPRNRPSAR